MGLMTSKSRTEVLVEAKLMELVFLSGGMEERDLRLGFARLGAPPWVMTMGSLFRWRSAVTGWMMVSIVAPINPRVKHQRLDFGLEGRPTVFQGFLKDSLLWKSKSRADREMIWMQLVCATTGAWADEHGNSLSLVYD